MKFRISDQASNFFILKLTKTYYTAENTHLLHKGKYHCTADLLFDWLGLSCFAYGELDRFTSLVESNPCSLEK